MRSLSGNLARKFPAPATDPSPALRQCVGRVVRLEEERVVVATEDGERTAGRAVSCLVAPQVGDEVLLAHADDRGPGRAWVLAVLAREGRDVAIRVPGGRLAIAAGQGIDLCSGKAFTVAANEVNLTAPNGTITFGKLAYLGELVHAEVARVKTIAGVVDSVIDRFTQRLKQAYRFVSEIDLLKAEQVDYQAKGTMRLHGRNSVMTADQLVKLDGEQIHMG